MNRPELAPRSTKRFDGHEPSSIMEIDLRTTHTTSLHFAIMLSTCAAGSGCPTPRRIILLVACFLFRIVRHVHAFRHGSKVCCCLCIAADVHRPITIPSVLPATTEGGALLPQQSCAVPSAFWTFFGRFVVPSSDCSSDV